MGATEARLRDYVAAYRDAIDGLQYRELAGLQRGPFASMSFGGGGTAYVLWRLGAPQRARSWLRASLADRRRAAFATARIAPAASSYVHGRGGLLWLRSNLEPGRAGRDAVTAWRRIAARTRPSEFMDGIAGHLTGIRLLLARHDDAALGDLGDALAGKLTRRVRARTRRPWRAIDATGFAHYWPGVLHALLAWHHFRAQPVPSSLADAVRALLATWTPASSRSPQLPASWCNGVAGMLVLWSKAYAVIGDRAYLRAASLAVERAASIANAPPGICCGFAGVAFALLDLARADPAGSWRERATEFGMRAIPPPAMQYPNGLFHGHAGLVCLALDLLADVPAGFPMIEA